MSCGVGYRYCLDLVLLWLWRRPAAVAPIGPLAWELPYAAGAAVKSKKKTKIRATTMVECGRSTKRPCLLLRVAVAA